MSSLRDLMNQTEEMVVIPRRMLEPKGLLPVKAKVVGPRSCMPTFSDLIEKFSYKPGYEFTLVHPDPAEIDGLVFRAPEGRWSYLYLKCTVPDSTKWPHEPYTLQFQGTVPHNIEYQPEAGQIYFLQMLLETFELHERDEWFRLDGKLVKNPHSQDRVL